MSPQLYTFSKQARDVLAKHHAVLFLSFIGLILAAAIYLLYQIIQTTFTTPIVTSSSIVGFDQKTIDRIKNLHDKSNSDVTVQLPTPRSNPFSE